MIQIAKAKSTKLNKLNKRKTQVTRLDKELENEKGLICIE